jgi:16S rRNA (cytosine967-C5)-methyltransferase
MGLTAEVVAADALTWEPARPYDAVLLDAPCTATGTCRRHPDVLHRIAERQITEMAQLQAALLVRAAGWLAPGGTLVYATCSLEPEEGENQVDGIALDPLPITSSDLPASLAPTSDGYVRTTPDMLADSGGLDGFFIARWKR